MVFLDISGMYAVLDGDDENHTRAGEGWREHLGANEDLLTSNFVAVEAFALVQSG